MPIPNIERPDYEEPRGEPGFRSRRARVGQQAGSVRLGASLWELPPGEAAYPYHFHVGEEELLFVLAGRPSLRTPAGWREVDQGEVLSFPPGEEGGHQLVNRTAQPVRFLALATNDPAEVVVYPDSGKIGAYGRRGPRLRELHRRENAVGYFEGESPPG